MVIVADFVPHPLPGARDSDVCVGADASTSANGDSRHGVGAAPLRICATNSPSSQRRNASCLRRGDQRQEVAGSAVVVDLVQRSAELDGRLRDVRRHFVSDVDVRLVALDGFLQPLAWALLNAAYR